MRTSGNLRALRPHEVAERPISKIDGRPASLPTVSAIIPCYNGAGSVDIAIASALAQSHHLLEIIVVDDGSRDATAEIAARYPVTVVRVPNGGPGAARNVGVAHSSGEWIAFLDHDDRWVVDKIRSQIEAATDGVGMICCPFQELHDYADCPVNGARQGDLISFEQLWHYNVVGCPSGVLIKRVVFDQVGGFDPRRELIGAEDYNLWQRVAFAGWKIQAGPADLFRYTPAHGNISSQVSSMLNGGLRNLEIMGDLAGMTPEQISDRRRFLRMECVRALLEAGDRAHARRMLWQEPFHLDLVRLWVAALLPSFLLAPFRKKSA